MPQFLLFNQTNHFLPKNKFCNFKKNFLQNFFIRTQRIYVIEEIEKTTTQTSNSLLHFFENPSNNNTIGFLLTNNLEQVLPTIVSRCQIINISDTVDAKSQNLDYKTKSPIDAFDFSLSNLINKNSDQMDLFIASDYYQNFKHFFLDFLIQFPKKFH
ncbi:hypothetical protein ACEW7V_02410 [Areca yellow leaf disease phytoplasma]|uniref:hypothetical protein n=1 Tax=Areca yellow leaf disease phytoplasma TaxID=927614 RepID=UPI0035B4FAF7